MSFDYEDMYVAYIDVLGFKQLIQRDVYSVSTIVSVLNNTICFTEKLAIKKSPSINISFISDSIFLSSPCKKVSIDEDVSIKISKSRSDGGKPFKINFEDGQKITQDFFDVLSFLQYQLLINGFICRGSVTKGKCYHNKNIVFGEAVNRAVELESKAYYPRVIIDDTIKPKTHNYDTDNLRLSSLTRRVKRVNINLEELDLKDPFRIAALKDHDGILYVCPFLNSHNNKNEATGAFVDENGKQINHRKLKKKLEATYQNYKNLCKGIIEENKIIWLKKSNDLILQKKSELYIANLKEENHATNAERILPDGWLFNDIPVTNIRS